MMQEVEFHVPASEAGMRVVTFCPLCKAQIVTHLFVTTQDALIEHMNTMHQCRAGCAGEA